MRKIVIIVSLIFGSSLLSMETDSYAPTVPIYKQYENSKPTLEEIALDLRFAMRAQNYWIAKETIITSAGLKEFTTTIIFSDGKAIRVNTIPNPDILDDLPNFSHNKQNQSSFLSSTNKRRLAFIIIGGLFFYFLYKIVDKQADDLV
jgi:hypothetical protein